MVQTLVASGISEPVLKGRRVLFFALRCFLLLLLAVPLFYKVGQKPLACWDEARVAVNAQELLQQNNVVLCTYAGRPETYNNKPPLLIWLQASFFALLGPSEFSARLPSTLAALATVLLLVLFAKKQLQAEAGGFAGALVLVTSGGYMYFHAARSADYDALLAFGTTLYLLAFYAWLQGSPAGNAAKAYRRNLWLFAAGLLTAVLTKGVAGCLFLPVLAVVALVTGNGKRLFSPGFMGACLCVAVCVAAYFIAREQAQPGYLNIYWQSDMGGRFGGTHEGHTGDGLYYLRNARSWHWSPYVYLLLPCSAVLLVIGSRQMKRFTLYALGAYIFFLAVISVAGTKLEWYDVPLYPLGSLLIGLGVHALFIALWPYKPGTSGGYLGLLKGRAIEAAAAFLTLKSLLRVLCACCLLLAFGYVTAKKYRAVLRNASETESTDSRSRLEQYVGLVAAQYPGASRLVVLCADYNAPLQFRCLVLGKTRPVLLWAKHITYQGNGPLQCLYGSTAAATPFQSLQPGDVVITSDPPLQTETALIWEYTLLNTSYYNLRAFRITHRK